MFPVSKLLSPDLTRLFLADQCHGVLYDLRAQRKLHEWALIDEKEAPSADFNVPQLAYAADGARLAVCVRQRVIILDANSAKIHGTYTAQGNLRELVFSPDAKALLLNFGDRLELLEVESGALRFSHATPHN